MLAGGQWLVEPDVVEVAGDYMGGMGCEDVTCSCLSSVEEGVESLWEGCVVRMLPAAVCPLWRMV